jgi:hypothetical protein
MVAGSFLCHAEIVPKKITVRLSAKVANWTTRKAREENTCVSKLIGRILEEQMRHENSYRQAYQRWKKLGCIPGIDAARRLSREEAHARR